MRTRAPSLVLLLSLGAGLMTGLSRFGDPLPTGVLLAAAATWWWRHPPGVYLAAALAGRLLAAAALALGATRCAQRLPPGPVTLRVHLTEPVAGTAATGLATLPAGDCTGSIKVRWPARTRLDAGAEAKVTGRWLAPDTASGWEGTLLVRHFQPLPGQASVPERLRSWTVGRIVGLYGSRSPTVEALILNRRGEMTPALRERYARAGLVHILSISGFHVGVMVGWVVLLGRLVGLPPVKAGLFGTLAGLGYVAFLGWPPPAARAALLATIAAVLHWRQRRPLGLPLLAVACVLVLLLDPEAVLDAGAWLSAASLAGVLLATEWSDRALGPSWFWRTAAGSIGATLAAAPVTAALFGTVSLAGILLNFVAIPVAALAVPGLFLTLAASALAPVLGPPLAAGSGLLLAALDSVAWWGGAWSWAAVYQPPEPTSAIPWLAAWLVAAWGAWGGTTRWEAARRLALAGALGSWALVFATGSGALSDSPRGLTLHFLDVGQGDATAVRTPAGRWVLIDAGPAGERYDAGIRVVAPFLARHRVASVAVVVVSHPHADHYGGLSAVLDRHAVGEVLEPGRQASDAGYLAMLDRLDASGAGWRVVRDSSWFELDGVRFSLVHPSASWAGWGEDLNEDSAVLLVEYGGFRALFPGDAGLPAEARLRGRVGPVDLLKVGHHGSRSASGDPWLAELRPRAAIISSGRRNRYGHPHEETLSRLTRAGAEVWRTDEQGTITVRVHGGRVTIEGRRRQAGWAVGASYEGGDGDLEHAGDDHRAVHPGPGGEVP